MIQKHEVRVVRSGERESDASKLSQKQVSVQSRVASVDQEVKWSIRSEARSDQRQSGVASIDQERSRKCK